MLLTGAGHAAGDGAFEVLDDPVFSEDTTLENGTWAVNGDLIIRNGTLTLDNASLVFNLSTESLLQVGINGRLVCINSNISGRQLTTVETLGPVTLVDTEVGEPWNHPIVWANGSAIVAHSCLFLNTEIHVGAGFRADNCTFAGRTSRIIGEPLSGVVTEMFDIEVVDSLFLGGMPYVDAILLRGPMEPKITCSAIIRNCTFDWAGSGISISGFNGSGTARITDCHIEVANIGISFGVVIRGAQGGQPQVVEKVGGDVEVGRCTISAEMGLRMLAEVEPSVGLNNLSVESDFIGLDAVDSRSDLVLRDVHIKSDETGMESYNSSMMFVNSSVFGRVFDFSARVDSMIRLVDSEHGFKLFFHNDCEIVADHMLVIERIRWARGPDITEGTIVISSGNFTYTADLGPSDLGPRPVTYWHVVFKYGNVLGQYSDKLIGTFTWDGVEFVSPVYPFLNITTLTIEIVDHVYPEISVTSPVGGAILAMNELAVCGTCSDRGSGLEWVRVRVDSGPWVDAVLSSEGGFNATVVAASEGYHTIQVTVRDRAGNVGFDWSVAVFIDSVPPFIIVESPGRWTNESEVVLRFRTELLATAHVDGVPVDLDFGGRGMVMFVLEEGPREIRICVVDKAGNTNETVFVVELDTVPPTLSVSQPLHGGWLNASVFDVQGVSEEHATVLVDGAPVERDGAGFRRSVTAADGEVSFLVEAVDRAGNRAILVVNATVDTQAPGLTVNAPRPGEVTSGSTVTVSGRVSEDHLALLTVQGVEVEVTEGRWSTSMDLVEGWQDIEVRAVDLAGNGVRAVVPVARDTTPPDLVATLMIDDEEHEAGGGPILTRCSQVVLRIVVDERCTLAFVDGSSLSIDAGRTNLNHYLDHDSLNVIEFHAVDVLGNAGESVSFHVTNDVTAPALEVIEPVQASTVSNSTVILRGVTETGAWVRVLGGESPVDGEGRFWTELVLTEGWNSIEVEAWDEAGNRAISTLFVRYEPVKVEGGSDDGPPVIETLIVLVILVVFVVVFALILHRLRGPNGEVGR